MVYYGMLQLQECLWVTYFSGLGQRHTKNNNEIQLTVLAINHLSNQMISKSSHDVCLSNSEMICQKFRYLEIIKCQYQSFMEKFSVLG